jgi:hypothetical protein
MKCVTLIIAFFLSGGYSCLAQNNCRSANPSNGEKLLVITRYSSGIGKSGYVDRNGTVVIVAKYDEAYSFSEGLALVRSSGKYGYINEDGTEVIKPQFDGACSFSEKLAAVKIDGKYGYIDQSGVPKIQPQFDGAFNFSEGLAVVKLYIPTNSRPSTVEEQFTYIDQAGKAMPAFFDLASDFHGGVGRVVDSIFGLETYITKNGSVIARKSNIPVEGLGAAPALIEISLESSPGGANVYLIPKRRVELDPSLPQKDESSLFEFRVPTGNTPTIFKAKQKVFTILFILNGVRRSVPLDVRPDGSKSARVSF